MSTDDFKYTNPKTPPLAAFKAEKKPPYFWIILILVAIVIFGAAYLVSKTGSETQAGNEQTEQKSEKIDEKKEKEKFSSKKETKLEETKTTQKVGVDISARLHSAEAIFKSGNLIEARKMLEDIYSNVSRTNPNFSDLEDLLGKVNTEIFKSDIPSPEKKLYTIQKGDALVKIAERFNTTVEAIQIANRMDPTRSTIFPGKTLCIYQADWKITVSLSEMTLRLFDGTRFFKKYKVGIGRQGRTPKGEFEISMKQKEPTWYTEGRAIPFGDKENILGTRWMALTPIGDTDKNLKGYGIHGTWEPETVGFAASNGCIRMKNEEVEELYMIVPVKTKVIIED